VVAEPGTRLVERAGGIRVPGRIEWRPRLARNTSGGVRIITRQGSPWVSVPKLDKLPEPRNLGALRAEVQRRWGTIDLLDILKDTAFITDFNDCFASVASREVLDRATLSRRHPRRQPRGAARLQAPAPAEEHRRDPALRPGGEPDRVAKAGEDPQEKARYW
jgi:hypothetical protein